MYAHSYFDIYPPFPHRPAVFVAMSFDDKFAPRYRDVIEPAITSTEHEGVRLKATRVDTRTISDSILTEIFQGVGDDILVLADITTIGHMGSTAVRSSNVMYEIGLAHAVRPANQVVIFRSDHDEPPFDVANIRINSYSPDAEPLKARDTVKAAIAGALAEMNLTRALAVEKALKQLDAVAFALLLTAAQPGASIEHPDFTTMAAGFSTAEAQRAVVRLLQVGAIETAWLKLNEADLTLALTKLARYNVTKLGMQILMRWAADRAAHMTKEQLRAAGFGAAVDAAEAIAKPT